MADKNITKPNLSFQNYKNNKLVISYNPLDFGKVINITKLDNETLYILQDKDNLIIKILKSENKNSIEIFKNADLIIKFNDFKLNDNTFVRILDNKKFYFENNQQILFMKETKSTFISKLKKSNKLNNNFITLDIETYIKNNVLIPYCISIFDGTKTYSYFLSDYKNVDDLIITALKSIFVRKYNRFNVYIHNMAKFDIIFLFKYLLKLGIVNPIIHNDRLIFIDFNFGANNQYQLRFKDSLLLLLNSLNKLSKSFKVDNSKTVFPIFFVSENNLDYIGEVPDIKYFKDINLEEYNKYKSKFNDNWNLKTEAIKYCNLDCISLWQVLFKFNEMIFDLFNRNIHHYPTLPALAFAIFRSNFMKEENIPQLSGKVEEDIRGGYTGGAVDMYIPKSKPGVKVKCLDVNSLYPSQMQSQLMPVGTPTFFEGDIRKIDPEAYGFFYCEIIAPDDIKHPIIQTHVKTKNGKRTISPIGFWEDMLFSEELYNAENYGYKFNILWGYTFKKDVIFKDYVDFLYNLRSQYDKSNPMNFIAKILMNSLYGRFGMNDNFNTINIIHKDYFPDFQGKFLDEIIKTTEIEDYFLVEFNSIDKEANKEDDNSTHNTNIAVASAITAYSRIHMTQFKNNEKIVLYYTDTDSIYVDENSEIPESLIDNEILGKLKLENTCNKAIFLCAKVYCLDTEEKGVVYKAKGLKHDIELTINDFEDLLNKDVFIEKSQIKFRRNLIEGHIELLEQLYTLKVTDNKRELIYNKNSKLIGSRAYKISTDKVLK